MDPLMPDVEGLAVSSWLNPPVDPLLPPERRRRAEVTPHWTESIRIEKRELRECQTSCRMLKAIQSSLNTPGDSPPTEVESSAKLPLKLGEKLNYVWKGWELFTLICRLSALSSPRGAWAFDELRTYHTRPLRLNWGPENIRFGKRIFWT